MGPGTRALLGPRAPASHRRAMRGAPQGGADVVPRFPLLAPEARCGALRTPFACLYDLVSQLDPRVGEDSHQPGWENQPPYDLFCRPSATGGTTILSDKKCAVPKWIGTKKVGSQLTVGHRWGGREQRQSRQRSNGDGREEELAMGAGMNHQSQAPLEGLGLGVKPRRTWGQAHELCSDRALRRPTVARCAEPLTFVLVP